MTDAELLQAMKTIIQQELIPIREEISEMKESLGEVRSATNYLAEWVEGLERAFQKHEITATR